MLDFLIDIWWFIRSNHEVIIALSALGVAIHQGSATIKHNKLSVIPFLTDHIDRDTNNGENYYFKYTLINNGLGPAKIRKFSVFYQEQEIKFSHDDEDLKEKIQEKLPYGTVSVIRTMDNGYALSSNEQALLLEVSIKTKEPEKAKKMHNALRNFSLEIIYESMYGEEKIYRTSKPDNQDD